MKITRIEQHQINKNNELYSFIDDYCFRAKNLYNYANYIIRQEFIKNNKYLNYYDMDKLLQTHDTYKELGSQASQNTLTLLDKNWKSFFKSIKDWSKNKDKYLGKPKLPKYKKKDGRSIFILKNTQCRIENERLIFSWKPLKKLNVNIQTEVKGKLMQVRFVPKGSIYVMEIVYETEIPDIEVESKNILGIDLGLNNLATLTNNIGLKPIIINGKIVKSINQYYNKQKAHYQSILTKTNNQFESKRTQRLTLKRGNKIKYYLHRASKFIINYCVENKIDTIVIGHNKNWKQEINIGKVNNQAFTNIPFDTFISMITYKAENQGIKIIITEESFTSGCSFLDDEPLTREYYNKSRRIKRGLFKSNDGTLINADVNGSLNIIRKVFSNIFDEIEGLDLNPIRVNF